jgi:CheY-like chemotaxis protein
MWVIDTSAERDGAAIPIPFPAGAGAGAGPGPGAERPRHLLLVEDNVADARLFGRRMRALNPTARLSVARDGASAMQMLDDIIEGTVPIPDLLVLDLNLPVLKGWEILHYVKRSPLLRFVPVVILSSSRGPRDVDRAYEEGAASFIHKGRDLDGFFRAVDAIHAYWFGIADLPGDPDAGH